jgi:hypothetical protein
VWVIGLSLVTGLCFLIIAYFAMGTQSWGLRAVFYDGKNFQRKVFSSRNKVLCFSHVREISRGLPKENFSVRWRGYLRVPKDGEYVFSLIMDDGARLFIDEKKVIKEWTNHDSKEFSKPVFLKKGNHRIRVDYYNDRFNAVLKLYWMPKGGKKTLVPARYLRWNPKNL